MRLLCATLLLLTLPALAAKAPAGCATLCGDWVLDQTRSDQVETVLDAALEKYKAPRPRYRQRRSPRSPAEAIEADMERTVGPIFDRPERSALRDELRALVKPASRLSIDGQDAEITIRAEGAQDRRLEADRPHSRVDALGTAKIKTRWKSRSLIVSETYDARHAQTESYSLQEDGTLLITREVRRPGMKAIQIRAIYSPG